MTTRNQLKDKNFMTGLYNFDIRQVTDTDIVLVRKIMNDPWM